MLYVALKRHSLTNQLATGISHLFCPPCVATGGMLLAAAAQPSLKGWLCAGTYICLAVLMPLLTLFWLMGQGQVSDLDVTRREERHRPFIVAVCGAAAAWGGLYAMAAPSLLVQFAAAHTIVMGTVLAVTLYWKISVHAAGATGVSTLVVALVGAPTVVFLPVLLVAWSRLYLGRHTLSQVVAGGLLGAVVFAALL
jgi:membrane-associated phospholipid phosphatase